MADLSTILILDRNVEDDKVADGDGENNFEDSFELNFREPDNSTQREPWMKSVVVNNMKDPFWKLLQRKQERNNFFSALLNTDNTFVKTVLKVAAFLMISDID